MSHSSPFSSFRGSWLARLMQREASQVELQVLQQELMQIDSREWSEILEEAMDEAESLRELASDESGRAVLQRLPVTLLRWAHHQQAMESDAAFAEELDWETIGRVYAIFGEFSVARHDFLTAMSTVGTDAALNGLVESLVSDPPLNAVAAAAPIAALFHARHARPEIMFPDLLAGLQHLQLAPAVMDLANFLTRHHRVPAHPAHDRVTQLTRLLEGLVAGLEKIQQSTRQGMDIDTLTQLQLSDSLSLAVSLCDALGMIGDKSAIPSLERVALLQHRRLRVEAIAALARLGEADAAQVLASLASEPSVRLRVVSYLEELQLDSTVEEQYRTPEALAEAELVAYLSGPSQYGVAPSQCEIVDTRTLYWPGYEEPRMCYLFRYTYRVTAAQDATGETSTHTVQPTRPTQLHSNIGLAGPRAHAMQADLCDLPVGDIYAIYAGWDAEHDEIFEIAWDAADDQQRFEAERSLGILEDEDYENITPLFLAHFFGDQLLVARAMHQGVPGTVIVDDHGISWHAQLASPRALGPVDFYRLYQGRRLLRAFNNEL